MKKKESRTRKSRSKYKDNTDNDLDINTKNNLMSHSVFAFFMELKGVKLQMDTSTKRGAYVLTVYGIWRFLARDAGIFSKMCSGYGISSTTR